MLTYNQAENYIILDIETTGLSSKYTEVILVGLIYYKSKDWYITQIFCDHPAEESELLIKLIDYIGDESILITYNGHAFDLPFLNARYKHHGIDFEFSLVKHFDLYRVVRASKKALGLSNYKLKTIEQFLDINRQDQISGKESVDLYYQYIEYLREDLRETILLHNYDDIKYMIPTLCILNHIPEEIIEKYYPFKFNHKSQSLYLLDYIQQNSSIIISLSGDNMRKKYEYHQDYTLEINKDIKIEIPIFAIDQRYFIDVDLLDFAQLNFNNLDIQDQLNLEVTSKFKTIETILKLFGPIF